jgi:cytochrome d ubiquinol oxidase subunit I
LSASSVPESSVIFSLIGFVIFYSTLAVVEAYLMVRTIRLGPEDLLEIPGSPAPAPQAAE